MVESMHGKPNHLVPGLPGEQSPNPAVPLTSDQQAYIDRLTLGLEAQFVAEAAASVNLGLLLPGVAPGRETPSQPTVPQQTGKRHLSFDELVSGE